MIMKDLTVLPSSPMSRLLNVSRFSDMFREFDNVFKNWDLDMRTFTDLQPKVAFPKVNVTETEEEYKVEIAVAGFMKEEVDIELKDNCLLIKANKIEETNEDTKKYLMKEISSRSFRRALNLPTKVDKDATECTYENGVVTCTLKKEVVKPESDVVKINIT